MYPSASPSVVSHLYKNLIVCFKYSAPESMIDSFVISISIFIVSTYDVIYGLYT